LAKVFYKVATDKNPKHRYFNSIVDRLGVWVARAHPRVFKFGMNTLVKRITKN
jgi:hypothetical protein